MNYGLLHEPLMIHAVLASTHALTPSYQYIYIYINIDTNIPNIHTNVSFLLSNRNILPRETVFMEIYSQHYFR